MLKNIRFVKWDIPFSKNINSFLWQDSPEPLFRAVDYDGDYDQLCHLGNVPALWGFGVLRQEVPDTKGDNRDKKIPAIAAMWDFRPSQLYPKG